MTAEEVGLAVIGAVADTPNQKMEDAATAVDNLKRIGPSIDTLTPFTPKPVRYLAVDKHDMQPDTVVLNEEWRSEQWLDVIALGFNKVLWKQSNELFDEVLAIALDGDWEEKPDPASIIAWQKAFHYWAEKKRKC